MTDVGGNTGGDRPMRRSRMLSDDARLAQQLQDEELRAGRGMKRLKIDQPSGAAAKKAKAQSKKQEVAAAKPDALPVGGRGSSKQATQSKPHPQVANKKAASASPGSSSREKTRKHKPMAAAPPSKTERASGGKADSKASAKSAKSTVPSDSVFFTLEPYPHAQESVPPLRRSSMTLQEDQTVLSIKRRVVEEAYPGSDVSRVEIRTPTGIKCGQDHSLKYVRTFLWPVSKGDLVLYYCQAPESFL